MSLTFILCITGMFFISKFENSQGIKPNGLQVDTSMFKMKTSFAAGSLIVCAILIALYTFSGKTLLK